MPRILDLGCGGNKQPGAWGVDKDQSLGVDQLINLDNYPWDLPDDYFHVVYALQLLEHLADRVGTMHELYRICTHGALIYAELPWGNTPGFVQDPTHKSPWNEKTFLYFSRQWPDRPYKFKVDFRMLYYWRERENRQNMMGSTWYRDNFVVVMQVIKDHS